MCMDGRPAWRTCWRRDYCRRSASLFSWNEKTKLNEEEEDGKKKQEEEKEDGKKKQEDEKDEKKERKKRKNVPSIHLIIQRPRYANYLLKNIFVVHSLTVSVHMYEDILTRNYSKLLYVLTVALFCVHISYKRLTQAYSDTCSQCIHIPVHTQSAYPGGIEINMSSLFITT